MFRWRWAIDDVLEPDTVGGVVESDDKAKVPDAIAWRSPTATTGRAELALRESREPRAHRF